MEAAGPVPEDARRRRRGRRRPWRTAALALAGTACLGVGAYVGSVLIRAVVTLPALGDPLTDQPSTSVIYDLQGAPVASIPGPVTRAPLQIGQIPPLMQHAFVAVEDRHFYQDHGISLRGIARAAWNDVRGRPLQGGSTITEQLAKLLYLTPRDTMVRKAQEAILGLELAFRYPRGQILAMYLNDIPLGDHAYGVQAAAEAYFSEPVSQLDLAQTALLAGLPQAPSAYDPLVNPGAALARRNTVLALMAQQGYVTPAAAAAAEAAPLELNPGSAAAAAPSASGGVPGYNYPWFVDTVVSQLETQYGLSSQQVTAGGLRIYTTLDPQVYAAAQQAVTAELDQNYPVGSNGGGNPMQSAVVLMDQWNGDVLAVIGGRTHTAELGYNRATQAEQQPGSSIKPLVDYIPALEDGYTAGTVVDDVMQLYHPGPGQTYAPKDDNNIYYGLTTFTEALRRSVNTVAVQVLQRVGVAQGVATARKLGLSDLSPQANDHLSVALGGTVGCCTPLEMADAYATIANGGYRVTPRFVLRVVAPDGRLLVRTQVEKTRVLSPQIAYVMTTMLETVDTPQPNAGWDVTSGPNDSNFGTGYDAQVQDNVPGWQMAAKTGTTNSDKQAWYVGYTPLYTGAVWVGRDVPQPQPGMYGGTTAGPILQATMEAAVAGKQPVPFARPAGVVQAPVDIMAPPWHVAAPGPLTPASAIQQDWFVAGTQPTQADGLWVQATVPTNNNGALWQNGCPSGPPAQETFLNLPAPYSPSWAQGIAATLGTSNWQQYIPLEASQVPPTTPCTPVSGLGRIVRSAGSGIGRLFTTPAGG
jgi:penicillin-binding protein 1A